jgi:peptidoglycan/LPS O-acetylase OafA/YrhL
MTGRLSLDNPAWSLVHEMRISLVVPLMVALARWNWRGALILSALAAAGALGVATNIHRAAFIASLLMSAVFASAFMVGIVMVERQKQIRSAYANMSPPLRPVLWLVAFTMLAVDPLGRSQLDWELLALRIGGSALLLALCISSASAERILHHSIPTYLGRVSYSLYLIHVITIEAVVRTTLPAVPLSASLPLAICLSIAIANVFQRYVEVPSMALGKQWATYLGRTPALASATELVD